MCRLFKPKDWYPVWTDQAKWDIQGWDEMGDAYNYQKTCSYEILHSPSRKKYKIITHGYKPKEHTAYHEVVQKLNIFINK